MSERISISKAAKLLNIKRSELHARLAAAEIETFEGEVDLEQVRCIAPDLKLTDQQILDRVRILRDAPTRGRRDRQVRTVEELESEVQRLQTALTVETQMAAQYRDIVESLGKKLGEMQTSEDEAERRAALGLCQWLREKAIAD